MILPKNPVLSSAYPVAASARDVKIIYPKVIERARLWSGSRVCAPAWPREFHLSISDGQKMADYLIVLDSLNFCFWSKEEKWNITYKGKKYRGYFATSLALKQYFEKNPQELDFSRLSNIAYSQFKNIFSGSGKLLMLSKRWRILRSVARILSSRYRGDSRRFLAVGRGDAVRLMLAIARQLPSFADEAVYGGRRVFIYKRAQILVADIHGALGGRGLGNIRRMDELTAFADYRLPQILQQWNILEYSPRLLSKIQRGTLILPGSEQEVEIRAATLWAVEFLRQGLRQFDKNFSAIEIDWLLWNASQKEKLFLPHHMTKTVFY